jgi:hypothetical protein
MNFMRSWFACQGTLVMTKKSEISKYLAALGRKGGKARVKNQTPEQRKESARKAAQARWAKRKRGGQ